MYAHYKYLHYTIIIRFWLTHECYTSIPTVMIREQCCADCSTVHGYHSMERSCHVVKVDLQQQLMTCDSIGTTVTQMI